tara:strand:- start:10695 stop:11660 length:966 start_codon:yes stop_codon:yes gene_type:complete
LSKLIKRDWRNWKPPSMPSKRSPSQSSSGYDDSKVSGIDVKPLKTKPIKVKAVKPSTKFKQSVPTVINNNVQQKYEKLKSKYDEEEFQTIIRNKTQNHIQEYKWSEDFVYYINEMASRNTFNEHIQSKDKRLQSMFARMISKYAEDYAGEATIGEDEWDMNELMQRGITKRNIYSCKQSRDRIDIALVLDSSPSCHKEANLFHNLASLSNRIGNVDIYLAPNARITHMFNKKTLSYDKLFDDDDETIVTKSHHMHEYFHNRTIFFFGDYDGRLILTDCSQHNKIYWFNRDYHKSDSDKRFKGTEYRCSTRKQLINIIKGMR